MKRILLLAAGALGTAGMIAMAAPASAAGDAARDSPGRASWERSATASTQGRSSMRS